MQDMDFGVPINPAQSAAQQWVEMLQGAIGGVQHPALRTGALPYQFIVHTFMPDRIAVVSLQGREAVNELYEYDVQVVSPFPPEIIQPAIFGANATLMLSTPGHDGRLVQGLVVKLACLGIADRGLGKGLFQYEMTIAPPMWLWTQRERNRVFQDQTVVEVAKSMLKADKIHHKFDLEETEYPKRALYYQRDETDFDFFKRILADAGIYFTFNHAVQDDTTGGVLSDIALGGAVLGGVGSAVSKFGGGAAGAAMGDAGSTVEELTKGVTMLVLGDDDDGVVPLHDFGAMTELGDAALKKGLGAASQAMGLPGAVGDSVKASIGLDASDLITVDDGYGGPADELIFSVELQRVVRPKSTWMLERDQRAPQSWAHIQRNDPLDPKLDLDAHLRITSQGIGADGGAKIKMDIDAPWIDAKTLEKELIQRNMIWLEYPSESRPKTKKGGGSTDTHDHLKHPLEQLRRDAQTATVTTSCRRLGAGYRFNVAQHPSAAFNIELTVLSLSVEAVDPEMLQLAANDPLAQRPFVATLECAPADDYAPRPPIPPRRRFPMELGTVIRWQESMDMVAEGRNDVYVRLDWDVTHDDGKARWYTRGQDKEFPLSSNSDGERRRVLRVPVMQPWAGPGYGLQAVPREGMQVLIAYLDSQGDRPVLLGCLHTDKNAPPWTGGYDAQRVGFRTQSRWDSGLMSGSESADVQPDGYSEISIDDTAGSETVHVRAEKDLNIEVQGTRTTTVESNSSDSVGGNRSEHTEGDFVGNVTHDATRTTHGKSKEHVFGSKQDVVFFSRSTTTGGDAEERVRGSQSLQIDGDLGELVGGSLNTTVKGNTTLTIDGGQAIQIGSDFDTAPVQSVMFVEGGVLTSAKSTVRTVAEKSIVFQCGTSIIEIGPASIKLHADAIEVVGKNTAQLATKDATVDLSANVEAYAKEIHFFTSGAAVDLTSSAKITASSIGLSSGSGQSKSADDKKDDDPKKKTVKVRLLDDDHKPLTSKTGYIYANGERTKVTTDGDGGFSVDVDPDATKELSVRVWEKDFPTGLSRDHVIVLTDKLVDVSSPPGAMVRLANLGFHGGVIGKTWADARAGVLRFQLAHADDGLEPTGELDDKTKSKLQDLHKG